MTAILATVLSFYLNICDYGYCKQVRVEPTTLAIVACESGNQVDLTSRDWDAVSRTGDTGAFQFSDSTWQWLTKRTDRAKDAPQQIQLDTFYKLWDNGYGWRHWNSSKSCWSKWMTITKQGQAVWNPNN